MRSVQPDRAPLYVESHGIGLPVVLAHGFGGSARNFGPQVRALGSRFRVVVFDARGHARSPREDEPLLYTEQGIVEDWRSLADTLGADAAIVGGLSMGAATAARFALAEPQRVRALVLASFPLGDPDSRAWAREFAQRLGHQSLGEALGAIVSLPGSPIRDAELDLVVRGFAEHSPVALGHTLRGLLAEQPPAADVARAIGALDVPVLVIAGEKDAGAVRAARAFEEHCHSAEVVTIPDAAHVVNLASPVRFNDELASFIERHHL